LFNGLKIMGRGKGGLGADKNRSTFCMRMENGKCAAACHKLIFVNSAACLNRLRISIGFSRAPRQGFLLIIIMPHGFDRQTKDFPGCETTFISRPSRVEMESLSTAVGGRRSF